MLRSTLNRMRSRTQDERGFTLIELLIVIIILGVLAAIVVFSVSAITDTGDESACRTEVRTVETAVEAYYAEVGNYPGTVNGLLDNPDTAAADDGFLREAPTDDVSNITGGSTIAANGDIAPAPTC